VAAESTLRAGAERVWSSQGWPRRSHLFAVAPIMVSWRAATPSKAARVVFTFEPETTLASRESLADRRGEWLGNRPGSRIVGHRRPNRLCIRAMIGPRGDAGDEH